MVRTVSIALALYLAVGLFAAGPAGAEQKEWDQSAVTTIARELAGAAGDLRRSVRQSPQGMQPGRVSRIRFQALDDLRVAENSINSLANRLEGGAGREETRPTYQRIRTLSRDIGQSARQALITEPTLTKLETARELLDRLAPYYETSGESG